MPTHCQRPEALAKAGDFIILYAGKPLVLATGDMLDEAEAHNATKFCSYVVIRFDGSLES